MREACELALVFVALLFLGLYAAEVGKSHECRPTTVFHAGTIRGAIDLCESYGGGVVVVDSGTYSEDILFEGNGKAEGHHE